MTSRASWCSPASATRCPLRRRARSRSRSTARPRRRPDAIDDNLVLKAARALAERVDGLKLGRFALTKRLPVAAGVGGGSSDAAAALRLLARANRIALDDPRLMEAARVTGADVPVCLDPRPRMMRGIGEILSGPLALPKLPAVLVNPRRGGADQGCVCGAPRSSQGARKARATRTLRIARALESERADRRACRRAATIWKRRRSRSRR